MSRAEISVGLLVTIISLIAFLAVSLVIVWPVMRDALFGAGEEKQCQFSLFFASKSQTVAGQLLVGDIPPECKMKRRTLTLAEVDALKLQAEAAISAGYQRADANVVQNFANSNAGYAKWAVSKIFADELVDCYTKVSFGSKDVTNSIFNIMGNPLPGRTVGLNDFSCLLCTRVTFDSELRSYLQANGLSEIDVYPFLALHTAPKSAESYAQFLSQQQPREFYEGWLSKVTKVKVSDPRVVAFTAKSTFPTTGQRIMNIAILVTGLPGYITKQIVAPDTRVAGSVGVFPYNALTSDVLADVPGGNLDELLITKSTYGRSKCAALIGD